ncbi:MAG: hypothetical protein KME38_09495 [Spirirestis rafaelensis WJT71-NPBG6]|nr:hypothetical protein [Spirirestis rafaelensis WJT71-NPBG6]
MPNDARCNFLRRDSALAPPCQPTTLRVTLLRRSRSVSPWEKIAANTTCNFLRLAGIAQWFTNNQHPTTNTQQLTIN